ncbi:MAG: hypothetical protein JWR16_1585 [Nevskia sp.]|nr:hypothetical protein [Nevskia sp.]
MSAALLDRAALSALIPHQGTMCLLDAVLSWDQQAIHCRAISHRDPQHPLAADGRLAALHLIEYGAQAMALHGGLLARAAGASAAPGVLALVREVSFTVDRIDDLADDLDLHARRLLASSGGWLYEFSASAGGKLLAQGRVAVINAG